MQNHSTNQEEAKWQICPVPWLRLEREGSWCPRKQVFMALVMLSFHRERIKVYFPLPWDRAVHPLARQKHSAWFWRQSTQSSGNLTIPGFICWAEWLLQSHLRQELYAHRKADTHSHIHSPWRAWHAMHGRDRVCVCPQYADILAAEVMPVACRFHEVEPLGSAYVLRAVPVWMGPVWQKKHKELTSLNQLASLHQMLNLPAS